MDWNRRHCARHGHITYAPTEPPARKLLSASTALGEAWRCLRCGDFTPGPPQRSGPLDEAPIVPRDRALRSRLITRLLALERLFRFLLVTALGYGVLRFANSEQALRMLFEHDITFLRPVAAHWGYDLDHEPVVDTIRHVFSYRRATLEIAAIALFAYAAIELVEAAGLWLGRRWGEYFAVVATALFLPFEVYELVDSRSAFKLGTLALNVLAVLYLVIAKRLFGVRGGRDAYEAALRSTSIIDEARPITVRRPPVAPTLEVAGQTPDGNLPSYPMSPPHGA